MMKYRHIRLTAYNESPNEENSFHVDVNVDASVKWTQEEMLGRVIKPAFACLFATMIPDMPPAILNGILNPEFLAWERRYYGGFA